jgi:hypothetical protein
MWPPHNELPVIVEGVGGITPLDIPPIPPLYSQRGNSRSNHSFLAHARRPFPIPSFEASCTRVRVLRARSRRIPSGQSFRSASGAPRVKPSRCSPCRLPRKHTALQTKSLPSKAPPLLYKLAGPAAAGFTVPAASAPLPEHTCSESATAQQAPNRRRSSI